jgi:hypothetical protein
MQTVTAIIDRGVTTHIPTVVFAHELPVLEVINGAGRVSVVEGSEAETDFETTPEEEFIRLEQKYGVDKDVNMPYVAKVYRHPGELAEAMGLELAPKPKRGAKAKAE